MASQFADPSLPLHIDIGSDRGIFCMRMAALQPHCNFLGIEIRSYPVGEAQNALLSSPCGVGNNCAFLHANANAHLEELRKGALKNVKVCTISLNFPDPWWVTQYSQTLFSRLGSVVFELGYLPLPLREMISQSSSMTSL
jgi:tRNA (guanine-N7-)-methyltransferase